MSDLAYRLLCCRRALERDLPERLRVLYQAQCVKLAGMILSPVVDRRAA